MHRQRHAAIQKELNRALPTRFIDIQRRQEEHHKRGGDRRVGEDLEILGGGTVTLGGNPGEELDELVVDVGSADVEILASVHPGDGGHDLVDGLASDGVLGALHTPHEV